MWYTPLKNPSKGQEMENKEQSARFKTQKKID